MTEGPSVVFVGGGPVGLVTALLFRLQNDQQVTVCEKREEYSRGHVVNISKSTMRSLYSGLKAGPAREKVKAMVDEVYSNANTGLFSLSIPLRSFEEIVKKHAVRAGVAIERKEVKTLEALMADYPSCSVFFGSDGAHSVVREQMHRRYNHDKDIKEDSSTTEGRDLHYAMMLRFQVQTSGLKKMNRISQEYPLQKRTPFFVKRFSSRAEQGLTTTNLFIFIDQQTLDYLRGQDRGIKRREKRILTLQDIINDPGCPAKLRETLYIWIGAGSKLWGEAITSDFAVSHFILKTYFAKQIAYRTAEGKTFVLIGDSARGFPLQLGLDHALRDCGESLRKLCQHDASKIANNAGNFDASFTRATKIRYYRVKVWAYLKSATLKFVEFFVWISNQVPWQTNKFSQQDIDVFKESGRQVVNDIINAQCTERGPSEAINIEVKPMRVVNQEPLSSQNIAIDDQPINENALGLADLFSPDAMLDVTNVANDMEELQGVKI